MNKAVKKMFFKISVSFLLSLIVIITISLILTLKIPNPLTWSVEGRGIMILIFLFLNMIIWILISNNNKDKKIKIKNLFQEQKDSFKHLVSIQKKIEEIQETIDYSDIDTNNKNRNSINDKIYEAEKLLQLLLFDLFHSTTNIEKFSNEEIAEIFTKARVFTKYGQIKQDNQKLEKLNSFINYIETDVWTKVYGKKYSDFL